MSGDGEVRPTLLCTHCGEALTQPAPAPAYCCGGCAAAADWIRAAGLGDFYRWRQQDGQRVGETLTDFSRWDEPALLAGHLRYEAGACELGLLVDGMRCAACAWLIGKALGREPGVRDVEANALTGRLHLRWDASQTKLSSLLARLASLGFTPSLPGDPDSAEVRRQGRRQALMRLGVALLAAVQAMMFSEALYLDGGREMSIATRDFFRWTSVLVATPVVFYSGWPFLRGFWREIRERAPGMDTLIGSGTLLAYGASIIETLRGGPMVWFDAAVMFVLFMALARLVEDAARERSRGRLDALARAQPQNARRERDGSVEDVPLGALSVGDVLQVPVGGALPADGELLDTQAWLDESLLTGEATPVLRQAGDIVRAGSSAREHSLRLRATRVGADTTLSQFSHLAERAMAQRPRWQRLAETVARRFVAIILPTTIAVFAYWWWNDPPRAFPIALAVLVATCPCALALAIPTAMASSQSALARQGMLVLSSDAIERLARVDVVVFDKTGTLTQGRPALQSVECLGDLGTNEVVDIAARMESAAGHPLAAAFQRPVGPVITVHTTPGMGIEATLDGRQWRLGRAAFAASTYPDDDALWLAADGTPMARFSVADTLRGDAGATIEALRAQGLAVQILSGDADGPVHSIAGVLGVDHARSRCLPADKLTAVRALQAAGHRVLMVGDGLNDAAVLAGADVAMALAGGAALARQQAGIVVLGDALMAVSHAVALARRTRHVVRQNLAWAVGYNVIMLPLAATGFIHPGWAALGMALSSLTVTANALRLTHGQSTP